MVAEQRDVETIFSEALKRESAAERARYLDGACGGDAALRARVETLLRAHDESDPFLSSPTADLEAAAFDTNLAVIEGPGTTIGRYKLLQLLGEGGFGVVYMAEQEDPVRRKVALKIIKLGMDTKQVIARFEAERQALAMMDHPNIAKVLDAGATPLSPLGRGGRPYFVMELVRGVPFTEYCDKNNLNTRERLELFIPICNAIQYAHHKGIIHRDIKPANVMVTFHDTRPVPKVIDFGVAKATNHRLTAKTLFTEYHQLIGTPEYMSPEQAEMSGLDIDTRSDVYSLGVLLYEILTGTTPFESKKLRRAGYAGITRIIREEEPPTPSTRVSMLGKALAGVAKHRNVEPSALGRLMRGDLDWMVMQALEKDRTRRYETPNALAADIERHLRNEPVMASPPSAAYKLVKFFRRNQTGVIAGSLVAAALIAGLALATLGFVQARRQRDAAEEARAQAVAEATRSQEIIKNLQETLRAVDPERVKDLDEDVKRVLYMAREVLSEASPMPVPFGKWAELDALRAANWSSLAEAVEKMTPLMVELYVRVRQGRPVVSELQNKIQHENNALARLGSGVEGRIPTHSPMNGGFSHPVVLTNLMGAVLERAARPFSTAQKVSLVRIGVEYDLDYDRLQSTYTAEKPRLQKLVDELALKRDCMTRVENVMTREQRQRVIVEEIRGRLAVDVLSPLTMVPLFVKPRNLSAKENARDFLPGSLAEDYEINPSQRESLTNAFDSWYEEVKPLLEEETAEKTLLHIDEVITAGRAYANLLKAVLGLKGLDAKTRQEILSEISWKVPRVVREDPTKD